MKWRVGRGSIISFYDFTIMVKVSVGFMLSIWCEEKFAWFSAGWFCSFGWCNYAIAFIIRSAMQLKLFNRLRKSLGVGVWYRKLGGFWSRCRCCWAMHKFYWLGAWKEQKENESVRLQILNCTQNKVTFLKKISHDCIMCGQNLKFYFMRGI